MKFIHAGDIHLDSPLSGLNSFEDLPADILRTATRSAFSGLIDSAIAERVNFVLFPGDMFDTDWRDWNTGHFFVKEMARLNESGIPAYLLRGNHDAEQDMTKFLTLPPNVHVFGADKPDTFKIQVDGRTVAIHGRSFRQAATTENLVSGYAPAENCLNIGVLHTALEGYAAHAHYAPCTLEELRNKGMQYWALGHVHQWEILSKDPWVAFSGNLQGRHIKERGPRGALLVTCENGEFQQPARLLVDVVRWELATVDLGAVDSREDAMLEVRNAFERVMQAAAGRPVACRVVLTGQTRLHGEFFGQERALRADVIAQATIVARDKLWIEKVRVDMQPAFNLGVATGVDAMADLQSLLAEAAGNQEFIESLRKEFAPLLGKVPLDVFKQDVPSLIAVKEGNFASLVRAVAPKALDRVAREE